MRRAAALGSLLVLALTGSGAQAAHRPQLVDPAGDYALAGGDIVSMTLSTTPPGKSRKLIVALKTSGPVDSPVDFGYQVGFAAEDCDFRVNYFGQSGNASGGCRANGPNVGGDSPIPVQVSGNVITLTIPATESLKVGTMLTALVANSTPSGLFAGGATTALGDTGTSDAAYVIGQKH